MADDLSHLFPNLAAQFDNWDGKLSRDGSDSPEHGGVTDDQLEQYLRQQGALRAPLRPVVSGQEVPPVPSFANNGRAVPPGGNATVEPPQEVSEPPAESTASQPPANQGEEDHGAATPPPPSTIEIAGRTYDIAQASAWAQFDDLVQGDAELRNIISQHLQRRAGGLSAPPPAAAETYSLPDLAPEYAEDPTIKALHETVRRQQDILDRVSRTSQQALETSTTNAQRTYTDISRGVISQFQQEKGLDDDTMRAISKVASNMGFADRYMQGFDPLTGAPVIPDPYQAVRTALETGYFMVPQTRQVDIDREIQARATRLAEESSRKEKLAGISGASGSVPRTQPVPNNPQDRHAAMIEEVRQAMFNES